MNCPHTDFTASVEVSLLSSGGAAADLRIYCSHCGTPAQFIGLPVGITPDYPTRTFDGTEARLPLRISTLEATKQ